MVMDFPWAMAEVLCLHRKVRRKDWNRPQFIVMLIVEIGGNLEEQIVMVMKNGKKNAYTPSQYDMFANDWGVYDEKGST